MQEQGKESQYEFLAVHEDVVRRVLETQPAEEELYDLAELFKVFGDSTRIRILHALLESELCVGDIAQILNLSQSAVSHQLKILKDAKLVRFRREGKIIFYSLDDEHVRTILSMGMEHIEE
ncbi:MAG: metalloregulator ArsR/SmtB family transcription factor [Lachnospiraceae bacterium]|nr:metalloregulator ArsR/SmtB family transcription factor [Lachnospiraceae bacterium]